MMIPAPKDVGRPSRPSATSTPKQTRNPMKVSIQEPNLRMRMTPAKPPVTPKRKLNSRGIVIVARRFMDMKVPMMNGRKKPTA
ncbi:hypothetical protein SA2016_2192 [Sinomonas atrocyanea]|uniref:Uncharacterized protein n=1 Tax=Sinomonas atrocyanea TaxID=37927 RepID=A0A127A1U5_9MICC|nr:hypothetical protein SA2016_2192 [Sinomonas atrocyanea]